MRIIRGTHQRRLIHPPAGLPVRPTTDMAKESLFNVLENYIDFEGIKALDLFAGTGNISYEMASRGCSQVLAVDSNSRCVKFIGDTASSLKLVQLQVIRTDVFRFLSSPYQRFDLVFADPPYEMTETALLPELVLSGNLLNPDGLFVLEHSRGHDFSAVKGFLEHRKYGKVNFSFFRQPVEISQ
ncbi:MAG: RsmD family RNA methyltransferase [Bacteroidales bacterium]|nr:RsmD family RNA methyltransferase [Bacteroidales bacterium]